MFLDLREVNLIGIFASLADSVFKSFFDFLRLDPCHNSHIFQSFFMHAFKIVLAEASLDFSSRVDFTFMELARRVGEGTFLG